MAIKKASLACTICNSRNYSITAGDHKRSERLTIKKFCKYCKTQTVHQETK